MRKIIFVFYSFILSLVSYGSESTKPTLNSLEKLQAYVKDYAIAAHELMPEKNEDQPITIHHDQFPYAHLTARKEQHKSALASERMDQLYSEAKKEKISSCTSRNNTRSFFHLKPPRDARRVQIKERFKNFLLVNNPEALPNYESILRTFYATIKKVEKEVVRFTQSIESTGTTNIAQYWKLEELDVDQKNDLIIKTSFIKNDISRFRSSISMLLDNLDIIQLHDIYLLAEQSFDILSFIENITMGMINGKAFFPDSNLHIKQVQTLDSVMIVEMGEKKPIKDLARYLHLPHFPLRNLYLFSRSVAFSLRDFANTYRMQAGLSAIPEDLFDQSEEFSRAIEIDWSFPDLKKAAHDEWIAGTPGFHFLRMQDLNKASSPKKVSNDSKTSANFCHQYTQTSDSDELPHNTQLEELRDEIDNEIDQVEPMKKICKPIKPSIGYQVFSLLSISKKQTFFNLIHMQEKITRKEAQALKYAVYRVLSNLNKSHLAAKFLVRTNNIHIFRKTAHSNILSNSDKEALLSAFFISNILPPDIKKNKLLKNNAHLRELVMMQKLMSRGSKISIKDLPDMQRILIEMENSLLNSVTHAQQRTILTNLAYAWHKIAHELESTSNRPSEQHSKMAFIKEKIVRLLRQAKPLVERYNQNVSINEASLFNHYLKNIDFTPKHSNLTKGEFEQIQRRAFEHLSYSTPQHCIKIKVINIHGKLLRENTVCDSIFHAVTNSELDDYLIVEFTKPISNKKIPQLIRFNDTIYRTDVFGGSRLKQRYSNNNYGSLFAVSMRAAEFFKYWLTSEESFWRAQRAFMPQTPGKISKTISGPLTIAMVPDVKKFQIIKRNSPPHKFIVQDGFGYIKASRAESLNLNQIKRDKLSKATNAAFQAFHAYGIEDNRTVASELFNLAQENNQQTYASVHEQANALRCTPPKHFAVGVPVLGKSIVLSDEDLWNEFVSQGIIVGKNPYSAKSLQFVNEDNIYWDSMLANLKVFQYSLTGISLDEHENTVGRSFKGLLGVIDDKDWPKEFAAADLIVSSKDQKLNQTWIDEQNQIDDYAQQQIVKLNGILMVTLEMNSKQLVGIPLHIAEKLAGDFDGDEYDLIKAPQALNQLVEKEQDKAILNPKPKKSFTRRQDPGNFWRIKNIRKPILETWTSIQNRFYHLDKKARYSFAYKMAPSTMIYQWAELDDSQSLSYYDKVVIEIQLGIKAGEDIFKTSLNADQLMKRAKVYMHMLKQFQSDPTIPYGKGFECKLVHGQSLADATNPALIPDRSGNIVDKAFRGLARYFNNDMSAGDGYVSDTE